MKESATILLFILMISSCNNDGPKKPPLPLVSNAQEKLMRDSIAEFPDSLLLKENLIQFFREKGLYDSALAITDRALQKDNLVPRLWQIKATLDFENEDTLLAIQAFEKAVSLHPERYYIISLGTLYAQTKNNKALSLADTLLLHDTGKPGKDALFVKGLYYTYHGDKQIAIGFFDQCLALDYTFMFAYREKAIALYDLHKYQDAITVLDKAVTLQNSFKEGYYWSGRCLEKLNRINDAIENYKTALLYDPKYIEAKDALVKLEGGNNEK